MYHTAYANGPWYPSSYVGGVVRTGTGPSVSSREVGDVTILVTGAGHRLCIIYWTGSGSPSTAWWATRVFHVAANIESSGLWYRAWSAP